MVLIKDIAEDQFLAYDIETGAPDQLPKGIKEIKGATSAAYCKLHMIAYQLGINSEPVLVETGQQQKEFRKLLRDPNIIKVSYNGVNFDDIVLWRYGYYVEPRGRQDMFLGLKTVAPTLPSYSLKFANLYYLGDWHEPERKLHAWLKRHRQPKMYRAPHGLLADYCKHDVRQTVNIFRMIWEILQQPLHWKAYKKLEMAMAEPLHEMMLIGGEYVDPADIERKIAEILQENVELQRIAQAKYGIKNLGSGQQVTAVLHDKYGVEFDVTEAGNFIGRKADWLHLMEPEKGPKLTEGGRRDEGRFGQTGQTTGRGAIAYAVNDQEKKLNVDREVLTPKQHIAKLKYEYQSRIKAIGYFRSYLNAARFEQQRKLGNNSERKHSSMGASNSRGSFSKGGHRSESTNGQSDQSNNYIKIAKAYYLSGARTRRLLSASMFGINFQNQNKRSKVVQLVPPGWLGVWIDSTQIENVVHIWASNDEDRRTAYEADVNWSEYVWLCNQVLGGNRNRKELEEIDSPVNPSWSIYKQFKTIKLALNFGMGPPKFAKTTGLPLREAAKMFDQVHEACPAIRGLQNKIRGMIARDGYVEDPFGHIYSGSMKEIYRVVSFLVQGMGTGSFPKAMTIANYRTLHAMDSFERLYWPYVWHPYKRVYSFGVLTGTTHDESALRISLGLPTEKILKIVRQLMYNMEERFSDKVGGIPLRAKIAFSITNAADQVEMDHRKKDFENEIVETYIKPGKSAAGIRTF